MVCVWSEQKFQVSIALVLEADRGGALGEWSGCECFASIDGLVQLWIQILNRWTVEDETGQRKQLIIFEG